MSKQRGYRIPESSKPCKFGHHWNEYLGEKWMGTTQMFEYEYDGALETLRHCDETNKCAAYKPAETKICRKHDIEYYAIGDWCELCHPEAEEL